VTIKTLSTRLVYENPWVRVREDAIEREDGSPGVYAVVDKNEGSLVIPWDGERVHLVGQVKYPVGAFYWEFPQGAIDDREAAPEDTARTELLEETGFAPARSSTSAGSSTRRPVEPGLRPVARDRPRAGEARPGGDRGRHPDARLHARGVRRRGALRRDRRRRLARGLGAAARPGDRARMSLDAISRSTAATPGRSPRSPTTSPRRRSSARGRSVEVEWHARAR
jgi:8-oxo-dGTP pyrophosphatase MutT (NUDIX family)